MDSTQPTASTAVEEAQPFEIHAADSMLEDLRERLARTRFIDALGADGWQYGFDTDYLRELVRYWREDFDWRAHEAAMNRFAQFRATVGGTRIHFIHERGRGHHSVPNVLTHGFPDSVFRFAKFIPMITDPAAHGGDAADAFDVIAPSLPGYGFSERPGGDGVIFRGGDVWHELMTGVLGYERFAAHGGDWGSTVTELLARDHAHAVIGIHLTDVPFFHAFRPPNDPSATEQTYLDGIARFGQTKGAYALVQGAQPQALAVGMNDSPAGLAAWLIEKFRRWSDCDGNVESRFTKDELLANVTLYWLTGTINSSFGPYYDFAQAGAMRWIEEKLKAWRGSVLGAGVVPAGFAMFPKDLSSPPREWAERFFDVRHWTAMPRGGHFAALEEPELLVQDIRTFFRPFR
jgi:pimeloyl-ACP methyl ester carboxylesterase